MSEWISTRSELPNEYECVDVYGMFPDGDGRIPDCFYDYESGVFWRWNDDCSKKITTRGIHITHWMKKPEPPK